MVLFTVVVMKLPKVYEPNLYEENIYALWEKSGAFSAHPEINAERFVISMPPPNATGTLHLGHSLGIAIQDIMIRYSRMQGKDALWVPGTDHAALPTNAIMEKQLAEEGTNKHQIGREKFISRLQDFTEDSKETMRNQMRAMGASTDWSRERYTLDDALNRCVNETFTKMYNDGLIYRGNRIVNWDPLLETTVSDDEVVHTEETGKFYTFQYGPFQISTTRPETKFGDKYVVMHPSDKRYSKFKHLDTFEAEWINGKVTATVIKDEAIDPEFGTGVMTITPWHDHTDFEIASRHNLDKQQIIDFHGNLLPIAQEFAGMNITQARPKIVEKLKSKGLLIKVDENYKHSIALNDRGKGIIEPQIKLQWFVDVNKKVVNWKGKKHSLKEVMRDVIDSQDITIVPDRFNKIYFHWIDNLRDWCVSRQIWWGHRIPVWYRSTTDGEETYVGTQPPINDGSEGWSLWEQDPDTLDTWFSSALWTWSTLIDPELAQNYNLSLEEILQKSTDFKTYHPTTLMETGWDILFFWVARMILATTYMTGQVPFKTVYLHGLVRNEDGQKMSKSKPETAIDPLKIIAEYGTDALRLALINGTAPGNDQRLGKTKIASQRNFCNKLWNIARFIEDKIGDDFKFNDSPKAQTIADAWIMYNLQHSAKKISSQLDKFAFSEAYDTLYHFVWDDFADWYIEASKSQTNREVLAYSLQNILKLAHPFAPFVTETIWQTLPWTGDTMLITSSWPNIKKTDNKQAQEFEAVKAVVNEIRYIITTLRQHNIHLYYNQAPFIQDNDELIKKLAKLSGVSKVDSGYGLQLTSTEHSAWLDIDQETINRYHQQVSSKIDEQTAIIKRLTDRLSNKSYTDKAPKDIIHQTREQLAIAQKLYDKLTSDSQKFKT